MVKLRRPLREVARELAGIPDLRDFQDPKANYETLACLREAERRVRLLRRQVEDQLSGVGPRACAQCRRPLAGRPDRKFCSDRCRQAAHVTRHAPKLDPSLPGSAPSRRREQLP